MSGVSAMRTLPTTCVHRCSVSQVSLHAASGKSGHIAFLLTRYARHSARTKSMSHRSRPIGLSQSGFLHSLPFRRRLRCQHPLCRFDVDERVSIEMCRDDIRPLIEDLMKRIVILNVENPNRAPPHASIDLPAYTSCFVPGYPRPERLPRLC